MEKHNIPLHNSLKQTFALLSWLSILKQPLISKSINYLNAPRRSYKSVKTDRTLSFLSLFIK